jgi:hypothetical protein
MRKQLDIAPVGIGMIEARDDGQALQPVEEAERYTAEQIAQWDNEDVLTATERNRILRSYEQA